MRCGGGAAAVHHVRVGGGGGANGLACTTGLPETEVSGLLRIAAQRAAEPPSSIR